MSTATAAPVKVQLKLGKLEDGSEFIVDANSIATGRTAVIGSSGSGKSYTVAVICEELLRNGVPFAIVDTEGEHDSLKEKFNLVRVGSDAKCDLFWGTVNIGELAKMAPRLAPLILDVSEVQNPMEVVQQTLSGIYAEISQLRTPYLVIFEEADRFFPQQGDKLPIAAEIAKRGRKRGIGMMICTQRPMMVDKTVLSQCGNALIGKLNVKNDIAAVRQFFYKRDVPSQLTQMQPGQFYAVGGLVPSPQLVQFKERTTTHTAATPTLQKRRMNIEYQKHSPEIVETLKAVTYTKEQLAKIEAERARAALLQRTYRVNFVKFVDGDDGESVPVIISQLLQAPNPEEAARKALELGKRNEWGIKKITETRHRWMPDGVDGTEEQVKGK